MIKKVYSSKRVGKRCDELLTSIKQQIINEIMRKHALLSYEEANLLFIRSLDTQKVKNSIMETSQGIKHDFRYSLTN